MKSNAPIDIEYFPDYLKSIREKTGMTQAELGAKVGVVAGTISMWESGQRQPNFEMIMKLAKALGYRAQIHFTEPERPEAPYSLNDLRRMMDAD